MRIMNGSPLLFVVRVARAGYWWASLRARDRSRGNGVRVVTPFIAPQRGSGVFAETKRRAQRAVWSCIPTT